MGKDPEAIEREIEDTRARMGERVDALAYKTDVKTRVGDKVAETRDAVGDKVDQLVSGVSDRTPSGDQIRHRSRRVAGMMRDNPLGLAVGAAAAGLLVGLLLPATRVEDERVGEAADTIKDRAMETGQEALDRGRQVAQDVARSASKTARESGSRQAGELAGSAREQSAAAAEEARTRAQDPG